MIGKVLRGRSVAGLLYLFGPGQCEEHSDPHLVAGSGTHARTVIGTSDG
jgi:hypothetical protein